MMAISMRHGNNLHDQRSCVRRNRSTHIAAASPIRDKHSFVVGVRGSRSCFRPLVVGVRGSRSYFRPRTL